MLEFTKELREIKSLQDILRRDIKISLRKGEHEAVSALKVILGEVQRFPTKELSKDDEIKLLKKLEKNEEELLKHSGDMEPSLYLRIVRMYLPEELSSVIIEDWIKENIDFSSLKNPMQAVGIVMKEFGARVDGKVVKEIVKVIVGRE